MRLLEIQHEGTIRLTENLLRDDKVPAYAILSHTWQDGQEVTFDEFTGGVGHEKTGYDKIKFCAQQAQADGLRYFWVDTCCINKADATELQYAINSMFRWYQKAARCYVFLSDALTIEPTSSQPLKDSRWFTRGWTLQELLAPRIVHFFSRDWKHMGDRDDLKQQLHDITKIPVSALAGAPLDSFSIDQRLSWAQGRQTKYEEDKAYSLLGLFGIFTFLNYGEGEANAFKRLRKAIVEDSQDAPQPPTSIAIRGGRTTTNPLANKASYYIPFPKNRYFVGRRDELKMLSQKLLENSGCEKMSIVGLGGTGKTQIALQFAYMVKKTMSAVSVFWLPALSMESFEQACAAVVTALHITRSEGGEDDPKELVREHLSADHAGRWLLVLDNADDHDVVFGTDHSKGIIDYFPESETGTYLFTTRVQELAVSLTRGDVLELGSMSRPDAVDFLEKSLIKKNLIEGGKEVEELLDELACLPLAIAQAAAFLNMNRTTITKYLRLLRSTEEDIIRLMSKEFRDQTRYKGSPNAVASTWVVSFSQLQERDAVAADLLAFMSCIEWKAIPRSLLPVEETDERMEEAIGTLCGYSFLSRRDDDGSEEAQEDEELYDMHRLVHLATRIWISKHSNAVDVAQRAIEHVKQVFPSDDFANRAIWRRYMPHALELLERKSPCSDDTRSDLCIYVGQCLHVDGRVSEAAKWIEECCQSRSGLEEDDSDRLTSQHELARVYKRNGHIDKAIELLEHVVAVRDKVLDEEHSDRLTSQHELARAYQSNRQLGRAIELLEHIVAVEAKLLKEDHPDRLTSQHTLARAYRRNGQVRMAIELLEHVVTVEAKLLEEEHPDRLASQHALATAYVTDGQVKEGIALLEHVVKVGNSTLSETHPHRLTYQHELGLCYRSDGQIKKAVALLEQVVEVGKSVLSETHPHRQTYQNGLALSYLANGQIKEAVQLLEQVVQIDEITLAETHPDRLASQRVLALSYRRNGQAKEAVALAKHVVKIQEVTLEETHPDLLGSQHELAISYWENEQDKEAVALLEHVVKVRKTTLAETHHDRQASEEWLSYMNSIPE